MGQVTLPKTLRNWLVTTLEDFPHPVRIQFWGGETLNLGKPGDSGIELNFRHPGVLRSLVLKRDPLVLTEAYCNGWFNFQGEIENIVNLGQHLAWHGLKRSQGIKAWLQSLFLPHLPLNVNPEDNRDGNLHSKERDRAAIQHHYQSLYLP